MHLDRKPVIRTRDDEKLIDAVRLIIQNNTPGIAVIDSNTGALINNFSASDLKGITADSFFKLDLPIGQVIFQATKVCACVLLLE